MRRIVLDPAAFLGWFSDGEDGAAMRADYEDGSLSVFVPEVFDAHLLEVAAPRLAAPDRLARLAHAVERVGFVRRAPRVDLVTARLASGWPMLAAQYAALAEELEVPLAAADPELRGLASGMLLRS